jgi:hypothetical protein
MIDTFEAEYHLKYYYLEEIVIPHRNNRDLEAYKIKIRGYGDI